MIDAQRIDEIRQLGGFRLFHRCNQILIGFLPKALHGCDFRLMLFQAEQIRIIFHKALFQKLLQRFLRKPFDIHGISGNKMAKCLYPLCGTVRVSAVKRFAVAQLTDFRFLAADKAMPHYSAASRPDFQILLYPVVTMTQSTHGGSRKELLGGNPTAEQKVLFSNELQVTSDTPQAFIVLSSDDGAVPPSNGVNYYLALQKNNVPASLHVYYRQRE